MASNVVYQWGLDLWGMITMITHLLPLSLSFLTASSSNILQATMMFNKSVFMLIHTVTVLGMANDWEVEVADYGVLPVGKVVLSTLLLVKGQLLLKLHGLSWLVVRMQEEINVFLSKKNEGGIYGTRSESTNTNGNSDMEDKDEDDMNKTDAEKAEGVGESELTEMDL